MTIKTYLRFSGCLLMIWITLSASSLSQTPEPETTEVLFLAEDCTRHCWFELLTSDSSSEEVYEWLLTSENVARVDSMSIDEYMIEGERNPETDALVNGEYDFLLLPNPILTNFQINHGPIMSSGLSLINIRTGVINRSLIIMFDYVTILEVLESLEQPDQIRFTYDGYSRSASLQFIYIERRLRINFANFYVEPPIDENFGCDILSFLEESVLIAIEYFSIESALETPYSSEQDTPQLIYYGYFRYVPFDVWEAWLTTDETIPCRDAYRGLSTEHIYPDLSILELTPEPTP